ncbi:MAG: alpha/beta hydrolase, partial [Thermoleophilia bacterium]|nr:alpha/beta hydrolase [Thermoleophilia bacterium]
DADEEQKKRDLELARLLPNGKLVHIPGAGHNVRRDKPAETLAAIQEFLAGV